LAFTLLVLMICITISGIIRRKLKKQSFGTAYSKHVHYQLMNMGYSHRASVLIIYGFSIFFGFMAVFFNSATLLTPLIVLGIIILAIQLIAEIAGITLHHRRPILDGLRRVVGVKREKKL